MRLRRILTATGVGSYFWLDVVFHRCPGGVRAASIDRGLGNACGERVRIGRVRQPIVPDRTHQPDPPRATPPRLHPPPPIPPARPDADHPPPASTPDHAHLPRVGPLRSRTALAPTMLQLATSVDVHPARFPWWERPRPARMT